MCHKITVFFLDALPVREMCDSVLIVTFPVLELYTRPLGSQNKIIVCFYFQANTLNDTHKQLMVHWVGENTDIIICLARDPTLRFFGPLPGSTATPSAVFISYNYGDTYDNKTEFFKLPDKSYASVDKFYNHQKYNTHVSIHCSGWSLFMS